MPARLLIACPDQSGLVADVTAFIARQGGNLLHMEQHTDTEHDEFFMRAEFEPGPDGLDESTFHSAWSTIAERHRMSYEFCSGDCPKRMAILVGRQSHCLHDLIWRWQAGDLRVEIPAVISNHDTLRPIAEQAGLTFVHLPIVNGDKVTQEQAIRETLAPLDIDVIVLARYMQILSADFLRDWERRVINIHHSFLPAFAGGDPYQQAYDRGVKIIGATSHYVTTELDAGPIIAQDIVRVSHRHAVADLKRDGRDLERIVLARAVRKHLEDKILVSQNKTVVFD